MKSSAASAASLQRAYCASTLKSASFEFDPAISGLGVHSDLTRGDLGRPSEPQKDLSSSGCAASGDLMDGRVGNIIGFNFRSSLNHFRQGVQHLWISSALICVRAFLHIPKADC